MEIEESLVTYLLTQTALTALVDRRIYYDYAQQKDKYPYIVGLNISDVKEQTLSGILTMESPIIQFTAYAETRASAQLVANQIKAALTDYQGTLSGVVVQYIKLINEFKTTDQTGEGVIEINTIDQEYEINFDKE